MRIERYSFWKIFFLSLFTFGIYGIYKNYRWTQDVNRLCRGVGNESLNYILVVLLSFITFGIYNFIWIYQQTERLRETGERNGVYVEDSGAQNLLLLLLTGPIGAMVVWYIMYDNTNRMASVYNGDLPRDIVNKSYSHKPQVIIAVVCTVLSLLVSMVVGAIGIIRYVVSDGGYFQGELIPENIIPFNEELIPGDEMPSDDLPSGDVYKDLGESVEFESSSVTIGEMTKAYGFTGNPAIVVACSWTNKGDGEASALWRLNISAFQNGHELLTTWPDAFDKNISMDEYLKNIPPGESIDFQVMFEVDNVEDPITIEVTEFMSRNRIKASKTFLLENQEA